MIGCSNNKTPVNLKSERNTVHSVRQVNYKFSSVDSIQKSKIKEKRVPSFLQKLNPFADVLKKPNENSPPKIQPGNVQTLKQFWIEAFGNGNKWDKKDYSNCIKVSEKSATLGTVRATSYDLSNTPKSKDIELSENQPCGFDVELPNLKGVSEYSVSGSGDSVLLKSNLKRKDRSKSLDSNSFGCDHKPVDRRTIHSDNFYKFKTASTVQSALSRSNQQSLAICTSIQVDASGKLQWARRNDIILQASKQKFFVNNENVQVANTLPTTTTATTTTTTTTAKTKTKTSTETKPVALSHSMSHIHSIAADTPLQTSKIACEPNANVKRRDPATINMTVDKNIPDMADFINTPQHTFADNGTCNGVSANNKQSHNNSEAISLNATPNDSETSELKNQATSDAASPRKLGRNTSGTRKYSFKTNNANFQRHSKKMVVSSATGLNYISGGQGTVVAGKVALLANRFNQLINQDKADVKGDKRKVIIHRTAGHIYKIKEESDMLKKKMAKKTDSNDSQGSPVKNNKRSASVKRKNSVKSARNHSEQGHNDQSPNHKSQSKNKTESNSNTPCSTVQAQTSDSSPVATLNPTININKPVVPAKSAQVLLRTKEIAFRNSMRNTKAISIVSNASHHRSIISIDALNCIGEEDAVEGKPMVTDDILPTTNDDDAKPSTVIVHDIIASKLYAKVLPRPSLLFPGSIKKPSEMDMDLNESNIPEEKIVEAIHSVNQRIASLSKTKSTTSLNGASDAPETDYAKIRMEMKPNVSFLFRPNTHDMFGSHGSLSPSNNSLVEAVNGMCILKAQSMYDIRTRRSDVMPSSLIDEIVIDGDVEYEVIKPKNAESKIVDDNTSLTQQIIENIEIRESSSSGIYQSISEVKSKRKAVDSDSVNSYESFENYETVDESTGADAFNGNPNHSADLENGYEICDPPTPPPPRRNPGNRSYSVNYLPQLPSNFLNKNNESIDQSNAKPVINYESVKYTKIPPRPPKSQNLNVNKTDYDEKLYAPVSPLVITTKLIETNYDVDQYFTNCTGENIYDTIKHEDDASSPTSTIVTGCYESIHSVSKPDFLRLAHQLKHSDSITTLSSDHKTNSLYGTASLSQNITPPSEKSLGTMSDNSDEWIDISDGDGEEYKRHKIVVIRKRNHRSPDWNRKVREQRMQQHSDDFYDDSDHYYETLNQNDNANEDNVVVKAASQPKLVTESSNRLDDQLNTSRNMDTKQIPEDDYDSFDSDDEMEDENIKKNDSGVDVSLSKLPDPPPPTNQVYAIMQKLKNFGSLSKSLTKLAKKKTALPGVLKHGDAPNKQYENTHFYVTTQDIQNGNASNSCHASSEDVVNDPSKSKSKVKIKNLKVPKVPDDPYENTEFHSPPVSKFSPSKSPLPAIPSNGMEENRTDVVKKNRKSGSSFRYNFRRSCSTDPMINLGSSFNGKRSTFYVSNTIDADSGVFTGPADGNLGQSQSNGIDDNVTAPDAIYNASRLSIDSSHKSISSRPNNPPPPPPPRDRSSPRTKRMGASSWYAECGVFKANSLNNGDSSKSLNKIVRNGNAASWYAEAGLYQTSGASVASSSGSSGVSTGGEGCTGDDNSHSMFLNEPLYQIYSAAKLESINQDIDPEHHDHLDGYEQITETNKQPDERKIARPSALQLVGPKGPSRTLWSEIPEVINSEILSTLTPTEKRLQEAKFEILTSEASYLKSLTLLRTHFMNHPAFRDVAVLTAADRKTLFSFIVSVQECSDRLLCDLENCWQDNIMLLGLSESVHNHADKYFHVYVSYCEHQGKLDRTLKRLKEVKTSGFCQTLEMLEQDPICCGLSLHSFLMLPMQRITRLPLLVDAVLSKLKPDDDEFDNWKMTLALLNKIVTQCNEAAKRSDQAFEMEVLSRKIEFPPTIRPLAILPVGVKPTPCTKPRALIKRGELTHLMWRGDDGKLTFGKKFSKVGIYVFLFTDLIVFTKKRSDDSFIVFDYCNRSLLNVSSGDIIPQLPIKDLHAAGKHLVVMTLLENYENKMIEMIVDCSSETERQRWLQATEPIASENPEEKVYEQWDCPQVITKHTYIGLQPDELSLDPGDIVNVTRKMADGWYQGERIRDGAQGWFPGNYTEEVESAHVRARNLKQRYRLLTFTAAYWESQKKK